MLALLSCDIGRGHPFYLDGLRHALRALGRPADADETAFTLSRGPALWAWQSARRAYATAGRGGRLAALYAQVRRAGSPSRGGLAYALLGHDLRPWAARARRVVVDHPILVRALAGHPDVWYQHGEHAAPPEAVPPGAAGVLVPTPEVADAFASAGFPRERLVVTGLCLEAGLAEQAEPWRAARLARLAGSGPLTVALFSSGAEPRPHVQALAAAALSLAASGHRALVVARRGGALEQALGRPPSGVEVIGFSDRAELDERTLALFPALDAYAAPAHERVNWALGLGLPALLASPDIGPFAPLNRAVCLRAGVAQDLGSPSEAAQLGPRLEAMRRSGALAAMVQAGAGRPLDGFARAAQAVRAGL